MTTQVKWNAERLENNPLISPETHPLAGHNIQGPSLIEVPQWVSNPLGRFYLYFADHKGENIGLAFADDLKGPWTIHAKGALSLENSTFPTVLQVEPTGFEGYEIKSDWAPESHTWIPTLKDDATIPHIASPDVHVDHGQKQINMYFHGLEKFQKQSTKFATSTDGLNFSVNPTILGRSYFRVFNYKGNSYALVMPGHIYKAVDENSPFLKGPDIFNQPRQRHSAVWLEGDTLWVFWTQVGDVPERIYASSIDLRKDWQSWQAVGQQEVLRPDFEWEGSSLPLEKSWRSSVNRPANQLRDPALFEYGNDLYLLYAICGESGIAIAKLNKE
jgi:hypothetical protein